MVQARTRVMNQLQAVALNEGLHVSTPWLAKNRRYTQFPGGIGNWSTHLSGRMTAVFTTFYDFLPSFNSCTGSFGYLELAVTQWIGTWETTDEVCPALE